MIDIKNIIDKFIYKNNEINILTFRKYLMYFFNYILILMYLFYSIFFYLNGSILFATIKIFFAIITISLYLVFKNISKDNLYAILLGLIFSIYSIIAYLSTTEANYGFMYIFFIPPTFVFLCGYKKGFNYSIIYFIIILILGLYDVAVLKNQFFDYISFSIFICTAISFLLVCVLIDYSFITLHEKMLNISITDPLTKLYNRRKIDEVLRNEIQNNSSLSVAILDIDDFKQINDKNGHQIGDEVLKIFSQVLQKSIRSTDILGRWGGEEFIIVLPYTNSDEAYICVNKIKKNIGEIKYQNIEKITCSFGIASSDNNLTLDKLILKADTALYRAKATGKNRIILAS